MKHSIVIVNEFTVKGQNNKGSKGSSPKDYILGYMAREDAVEEVAPLILADSDRMSLKYAERKEMLEHDYEDFDDFEIKFKRTKGHSGVAFSKENVSLSHESIIRKANNFQNEFENGKTIMKTVISFDEEYLKENGVMNIGFLFNKEGDYKSNIDQLKLRMSIQNGMNRLARLYDDFDYLGVIQFDTKHIHCHLVSVDKGKGNITDNGTQKGKIGEKGKNEIRQGIDIFLKSKIFLKQMYSNNKNEKRNKNIFVNSYEANILKEETTIQYLIGILPNDKNIWKYPSANEEMKNPNNILSEFVDSYLFKSKKFEKLQKKIEKYPTTQKEEFYNNFKEKCINKIYNKFKTIDEKEKKVSSKVFTILRNKNKTIHNINKDDKLNVLVYNICKYNVRLKHHVNEKYKYEKMLKDIDKNNISDDGKVVPIFLNKEIEYNTMLACKYQHFLKYDDTINYDEELEALNKLYQKTLEFKRLENDDILKNLDEDKRYAYIKENYNFKEGVLYMKNNEKYNEKKNSIVTKFNNLKELLDNKSFENGHSLELENNFYKVKLEPKYKFDDVKHLDLHVCDSSGELYPHFNTFGEKYHYNKEQDAIRKREERLAKGIPDKIIYEKYLKFLDDRTDMYGEAINYLDKTNQEEYIKELPNEDIQNAKSYINNAYNEKENSEIFEEENKNTFSSVSMKDRNAKKAETIIEIELDDYLVR